MVAISMTNIPDTLKYLYIAAKRRKVRKIKLMSGKQAMKNNVLGNSMAKQAKIDLRTNTSLRVTETKNENKNIAQISKVF